MIAPETPAELRARPLSAEAKAELRRWVPRYEHRAMTSGDDTLALLDEIDALLARLTAAEAEIANLARWKAEAMAVLTEWDACYDILEAVGRGAPIGRSKARHVAEYLKRQTGAK